jgi:hypothetical protein
LKPTPRACFNCLPKWPGWPGPSDVEMTDLTVFKPHITDSPHEGLAVPFGCAMMGPVVVT